MQLAHHYYQTPAIIYAMVTDDYGNLVSLNDLQHWHEDASAALRQACHHIDGYYYTWPGVAIMTERQSIRRHMLSIRGLTMLALVAAKLA